MCKFETLGISWPPKGWEHLKVIYRSSGQSLSKDPRSACVNGLSYQIEPLALYNKNQQRSFVYAVQIEGWEYAINNDSREFQVLSFMLRERPDENAPKDFYISDIKVNARPLRVTERSAHRVLMAAQFMIKQIDSDLVPETERILRLYKIHPSQRSLYDIDNTRADSLYCGLPYAGVSKKDGEESEMA